MSQSAVLMISLHLKLSSLMSLVPCTSNWLLHWHSMPCWSSLSSFLILSSLVFADVHCVFYWWLHSIDYLILFAPLFPLFVPRRHPWRCSWWRRPLLFESSIPARWSIGYGNSLLSFSITSDCIVIQCGDYLHAKPSSLWPIINHSISIPSTKDILQSLSPSSFIRHPPPSFADKQEATIPSSSGNQLRRD